MENFIDIIKIFTAIVSLLAVAISYKNINDSRKKSLKEFNDKRNQRKNEKN